MRKRRFRPGRGRQEHHRGGDRGGERSGDRRRREPEEEQDFWSRVLPPGPDHDFLEKATCPGCGNTSAHLSRLGPTLLRRCRDCDLSYVSPRLTDEVRGRIHRHDPTSLTSERNLNLRHVMAEQLQNMHREMLPLGNVARNTLSLLEVDCRWGHFLQLCRPHYGEVQGLEMSREMADFARERFDLEISPVDVLRDGWKGRHDFIVAWDLIERLPDPLRFLRWAHDTLLPGGQIILSTPNYDSLYRRLLGKRWFPFNPARHLVYFTPRTMRALLEKAGFGEVVIHTSGRSLLRERWNNHNRVDRSLGARDQWLQMLRIREKIEAQREATRLDRSNPVKRLWHNIAWHVVNLLTRGGQGDQMRVYARRQESGK